MAEFGQLYEAIRKATNIAPGVTGFAEGFQQSREQKLAALKAEAAKLQAQEEMEMKRAGVAQRDAELQLKAKEAGRESTVFNPTTGQSSKFPGTQAAYDTEKRMMSFGDQPGTAKVTVASTPKSTSQASSSINPQDALFMIGKLKNTLNQSPSGVIAGGISSVKSKLTGGALDPSTRMYNDELPAAAAAIYRSVTKDTRLSDQDAASRAIPMLPSIMDTKEVQDKKWAYIESIINNSANSPVSPDAFSGVVLGLNAMNLQQNEATQEKIGRFTVEEIQ